MARARNIKPGFFRNEVLAECSAMARLLFIGLWCEADREGRLEYRPKRLKAAILPYDDACSMHDLTMELVQKGFVRLYKVGADEYLEVCNFLKHQQPHHKEAASVIPAPDHADSHAQAKHEPSMSQGCPNESAPCLPDVLIPDSLNPSKGASAVFVLPDWIPQDAWRDYEEMRKKVRKPMTGRARELAVKELENLKSQGFDPRAVLEQSTLNSWQGLFPLKAKPAAPQPKPAKKCSRCDKPATGWDGADYCETHMPIRAAAVLSLGAALKEKAA